METLDISVNIKYDKFMELLKKEEKLEIAKNILKEARKSIITSIELYEDEMENDRDIETILEKDTWRLDVVLVNKIDKFLKE